MFQQSFTMCRRQLQTDILTILWLFRGYYTFETSNWLNYCRYIWRAFFTLLDKKCKDTDISFPYYVFYFFYIQKMTSIVCCVFFKTRKISQWDVFSNLLPYATGNCKELWWLSRNFCVDIARLKLPICSNTPDRSEELSSLYQMKSVPCTWKRLRN